MKVFVTGGTGFIGGAWCANCAPAVTMSSPSCAIPRKPRRWRSSAARWSPAISATNGRSAPGWRAATRPSTPRRSTRSGSRRAARKPMQEANVGGTERVLGAALEAGIAQGRLRLHRRRLRQHPRPGRRRELREPGRQLHLRVREDEVGSPPGRQAADRRGAALRDRPARRRLRPRRHLLDRRPARAVPRRQDAADPLPGPGDVPDPRRGHRRRDPAGARQGQAGRGLRPQRPGRPRCARRSRSSPRETGKKAPKRAMPVGADEGDDPDRPAGRQRSWDSRRTCAS